MILPRRNPTFISSTKSRPHGGEFGLVDVRARPVRVDAVSVQKLIAVDVSDARNHGLIHQQCADRPARLMDSRPCQGAVGVLAQRVRPEFCYHVGDFEFFDNFADGRTAQVGTVLGTDHPHPHLADRKRHRIRDLGERAVQPQVHVHGPTALVVMEQVLAPGAGLLEDPPVHRGGAVDESTLRAGYQHRRATEAALV